MFKELAKKRRSIRTFYTSLEVSTKKLIEILDTALYSPSAGDLQPWNFIIIKNREKIEKIAEITGEEWVISANTLIAVVGNKKIYEKYFGEEACELLNQTIGACVLTILLEATEKELGSCWIAGFEKEKINELLKVPEGKETLAIIALGVPAEKPKPKSVKNLSLTVFYEEFGEKYTGEIKPIDETVLEKLQLID
jgi:nitroreductase